MTEKQITVLKLGGSLLTDKSIPNKIRENTLKTVAQEIKDCLNLGLIEGLVLIHGVGSYGHPPVLKYKLYNGFKNAKQLYYLSKTQYNVNKLRNMIAKSLIDVEIPVNLMHASSIVVGKNRKITEYMFRALKGYLSLGMVPLLGGDMIYDEIMGFSICSGDQLAVSISREIGANRLIFATDVPGAYNKDPKMDPKALLLKEININEIEQVIERMEESDKIDTSGRMRGKLKSLIPAKDLIKKGLEISIISMMEPNTLKMFLEGNDVHATRVIVKKV
jgi:isopentenyl phosphate kinase